MHVRALALAAVLFAFSATARAESPAPRARRATPQQTTGIVLTSVGGSLVLSAPVAFLVATAYVSSNPYSYSTVLPVTFFGAAAGAVIGLGLLVPGIVMLATCKHPKAAVPVLPEKKQPAWIDDRPVARGGPRTFTMPLFRGTF